MPPKTKITAKTATSKTVQAWRINTRALIWLGGFLVLVTSLSIAAWALQTSRGRITLLTQAKTLAADKKDDLALSYLKEYLSKNPNDLDALILRGKILKRSAQTADQLGSLEKNDEFLLRRLLLDSKGDDPRRQVVKRRLVETYLEHGPFLPVREQKYVTAEKLAAELVTDPKDLKKTAETKFPAAAKPKPSATADELRQYADDLRLHAKTLVRMGAMGDREKFTQAAIRYEEARALDPGNTDGANSLARLYQFEMKSPAKAATVLKELVDAPPTPLLQPDDTTKKATESAAEKVTRETTEKAGRYLTVAKFYTNVASDAASNNRGTEVLAAQAKAQAMIELAIKVDGKSLPVCLTAAEIAIANKQPAEAAKHLGRVPEKNRKDLKYRMLEGMVALYENNTAEAIKSWSDGLKITSGGDADLSWKLAFVLLQLGRVDEAEPLISQYRRNVGLTEDNDVPPQARYLEALKFLKSNRPLDAITELDKAQRKIPEGLKPQFHYTLGQAAEAVRDEVRALEEYQQAILADPKNAAPRLARARLLQIRKPDEALAVLKNGLEANTDDVSLLCTLAKLELGRQLRLPKDKRSWKDVDSLLARARKIDPGAPALAVVSAQSLTAQDKITEEAASDLLTKATAEDKTDLDLWIARAEGLVRLARLDQALAVIDEAMSPKAVGDQAPLRILRARILTIQGHGTEARDSLVRDTDRVRADQRPQLWMALGNLYTSQNNPASARKSLAEWAKLLPHDPLPRLLVLELSLADTSDEAEAMAQECRDVLKQRKDNYSGIGQAAYLLRDPSRGQVKETEKDRAKRLQDAEKLIVQIEKDDPNHRYAHLLRGALEQQRNKPLKAAEAYEKALKTDGGMAVLPRLIKLYNDMGKEGEASLTRLSQTYPQIAPLIARTGAENAALQGNKERAEELARQVVEGSGESLDARVWQAKILNTLGKPEEAEKTLRGLIEKNPDSLGPWLALMYFQVGRKDQPAAVKTVETMITKVKNIDRPELIWAQAWRIAGERDRADKAFEAALSLWPDDPRVGRAAAEYYETTGRRLRAEAVLRKAIERDVSQRWASRGLAMILSARSGDIAAWRKAWDLVKDPAPGGDLPEDRLIRALVLAQGTEAANRVDAVKMLKSLVADLPGDLPIAVTSRQMLAKLLLKSEPAEAAAFAAPDALAANAGPRALTLHTDALIAAKKYDDADRQLDRLASIAPDDATTVTLRARLLRARGQSAQAAEALERSAPEKIAGPDGENAGRIIVQILLGELNQADRALKVATLLMEKFPSSAGVKATVLASLGRRDEALKLYLEVVKTGNPSNIRDAARNSLALISRDKASPASIAMAESVIDSARKKDPNDPDLLAMAGYIRHYQNRFEEEVKIYEEALYGLPDDYNLLNNLAWALCEGVQKPEQALERINQAIKKAPVVPSSFYDTRGVILTRLGKYDEAIRDLQFAVVDRPTGLVWAHLARAYHKANRMDDFKKARDNAKKATPPLTPDLLEKSDRGELERLIFEEK